MSTTFIETPGRVFSITVTPSDTPGVCRRTLRIAVESGPELTEEEADTLMVRVVADAVARGFDVIGWGVREEGDGV